MKYYNTNQIVSIKVFKEQVTKGLGLSDKYTGAYRVDGNDISYNPMCSIVFEDDHLFKTFNTVEELDKFLETILEGKCKFITE